MCGKITNKFGFTCSGLTDMGRFIVFQIQNRVTYSKYLKREIRDVRENFE